jgi:5-methylcytosine-specific restriction endonuclease McrA
MKKYECRHCGKIFDTRYQLGGHSTTHSPVWKKAVSTFKIPEKWEERVCPCCGKLFNVNVAISAHRRYAKRYCSQLCSRQRVVRLCKCCGKRLYADSKGMFCSRVCSHKYKRQIFIKAWFENTIVGTDRNHILCTNIRTYLLEKEHYKCSSCGWGKQNAYTKAVPLTIHHKDGNYKNNRPSNLEVLCPNCHSLTEFYGSRNRGRGRENRHK